MKLIASWRLWWRRWSTWLAALAAGIASAIVASPGLLVSLVGFVPADWRPFLAGATFVIVFVVPVLIAQLKQHKLEERADGKAK